MTTRFEKRITDSGLGPPLFPFPAALIGCALGSQAVQIIMGLWGFIGRCSGRKRPTRTVVGEARRHSCQVLPQDIPLGITVAALRPEECVVHIAYKLATSPAPSAPHRFFRVSLTDLTVTAFEKGYSPNGWGDIND